MNKYRVQISLKILLLVVAITASLAWAVRERLARKRAENRAAAAEAEADRAQKLADAINTMSMAVDGERIYLWNTKSRARGTLTAIHRAKNRVLWQLSLDLYRHRGLTPVSPPQVDGNLLYVVDVEGNREVTVDARTGALIAVRTK